MRSVTGNKRRPDESGNLNIYKRPGNGSSRSVNKENCSNQDNLDTQSTPTNPTQVKYNINYTT